MLGRSHGEAAPEQLPLELPWSGFPSIRISVSRKARRARLRAEAAGGQQGSLVLGSQNSSAAAPRADSARLSCFVHLAIEFGEVWKIHLLVSVRAGHYLAGALGPQRMLLYKLT